MNVSEINGYYSSLLSSWSVSGTSSTQSTASQILAALAGQKNSVGSASGDSAELSLAGLMMAGGMPPMLGGGPPDNGLKELVDKVAAGTASDDEVKEFTSRLKDLATRMQERVGGQPPPGASDSEMESLREKILDGTATDDDIKAIAAKLQEMEKQRNARFGEVFLNNGSTYAVGRR